jgi:hypothetical protein
LNSCESGTSSPSRLLTVGGLESMMLVTAQYLSAFSTQLISPNTYIIETQSIYSWHNNFDSAFMNIKRTLPFSVTYKMDNMKFFVDSESGDVTYTNHGDL